MIVFSSSPCAPGCGPAKGGKSLLFPTDFETVPRAALKKLLHVLILLTFVVCGDLYAVTGSAMPQVEFSDNKLTVDVDNIPLGVLLAEVHEKTGVRFSLDEGESRKIVSLAFRDLPLDTAIRRILRTSNHAMVFSPAGALEQVIVAGEGGKKWSLAENGIDQVQGASRPLAKVLVSREDRNAAYAPVGPATQVSASQRNPIKQAADSAVSESPTAGEMQIATPADQMVVASRPDVRMEISRASTTMLIQDGAGQRMNIDSPQNQNLSK